MPFRQTRTALRLEFVRGNCPPVCSLHSTPSTTKPHLFQQLSNARKRRFAFQICSFFVGCGADKMKSLQQFVPLREQPNLHTNKKERKQAETIVSNVVWPVSSCESSAGFKFAISIDFGSPVPGLHPP